jgi:transposase
MQLPEDGKVVIGVDVAKTDEYAALMDESQKVHLTVRWKHPEQSGAFIEFLQELSRSHDVEVAMESTGTYGEALRAQLMTAGFAVYQVHCKRTHDAAEVYDGVPSWHDAKAAAIIGKLHLDGASKLWPLKSDDDRTLRAALRVLTMHEKYCIANTNRLESLLAICWPELLDLVELTSVTLVELLCTYGGPAQVIANEEQARKLIKRVGRYRDWTNANAIVQSAQMTLGLPQIEAERQMMIAIASEVRRSRREAKKAHKEVERLTCKSKATATMASVVGPKTAAVLVAAAGDPQRYESAKSYVKSLGLNLKEKTSGKQKHRGLHITKRGPATARMFLYMATLRLIRNDAVFKAWHLKKVQRLGGRTKTKSVVALMRKLAMALWHVAQGSTFDSELLFDVQRLGLGEAQAA